MATTKPAKVFISYSHDSRAHRESVLALANRLRREGIDCQLDQYESAPAEGWLRWMKRQIETADFVLMICTELYEKRFAGESEASAGLGVNWESMVITQAIYAAANNHDKFVPLIFTADDARFRPLELQAATFYNVGTEEGYEDLYRRLTSQHATPKPELGALRKLSVREGGEKKANPRKQAVVRPVAATPPPANEPRVLLMKKQENQRQRYEIIPAERIQTDTTTTLHLIPTSPRQAAFLADLRDTWDKSIAVAIGLDAFAANVEKVMQVREPAKEVWALSLQPDKKAHGNSWMEISFNGYSPDDLAELRARRILLNEQNPNRRLAITDRLNAEMIEHSISGRNEYFGNLHSPFPVLYAKYKDDEAQFLYAAQLFAVLFLGLSHTVKHIFKLDLKLQEPAKLSVRFEGQRPSQYANAEPRVIKVKGDCPLFAHDNDDDWTLPQYVTLLALFRQAYGKFTLTQ